jgi:hypothetical protein
MANAALLVEAWCLLGMCWVALTRFGLVAVHRAALEDTRARLPKAVGPERIARVEQLRRIVDIAARRSPAPATCLTRSLVLGWLLRRRGVDAQLRIGVRLVDGQLCAHAWLECDGAPLNEQPAVVAQYSAFEQPLPPHAFRAA